MGEKTGCLIIHGFNGNTSEIARLDDYLRERGFVTNCPRLKGHTGRKCDMAGVGYNEWIKSAEEGLLQLRPECGHIIIIGFSMGGLIAVNLLTKHEAAALVTLNTPIFHWDIKRIALNIISDCKNRKAEYLKQYIKASFNQPVSALINFKALLLRTKRMLNGINCPVFIAQGLLDDTSRSKSAKYLYRNIRSERKMVRYYKNSGHQICDGPDSGELFNDVLGFINSLDFGTIVN